MDIDIDRNLVIIAILVLIILVLMILLFFASKPKQCNTSGVVFNTSGVSTSICSSELRFSSGTYEDKNQVVSLTISLSREFSSDYLSNTSGYSFVFYMIKCKDSSCKDVNHMNEKNFYLQLNEIQSPDNLINMLQDKSKIYKINFYWF